MHARTRTPWFSGRALTWGLASFLLFAVTFTAVLVAGSDGPLPIDAGWASAIEAIRVPVLTTVGLAFNTVGGTTISVLVIVLALAWLLYHRRPWALLTLVATSGVTVALTQGVKWWVERPRPESIIVESDFGSFPSGHSSTAVMLVTVFALLLHRHWFTIAATSYALLMMLSRTYLGAHWLTDVLGGALLGLSVALLVWAFTGRQVLREQVVAGEREGGRERKRLFHRPEAAE